MTAQQLASGGSSSTDPSKALKQALQHKPHSEPYRREEDEMATTTIPQQQREQQEKDGHQTWGVDRKQKQEEQRQQQHGRRQHLTVVTDTDADTTVPPPVVAGGGGGAAIPMSPPSSPTHVVATHAQEQAAAETEAVGSKPLAMEVVAPSPVVSPPTTPTEPEPQTPTAAEAAAAKAAGAPAAAAAAAATPAVPIRLGRGRKLCPNCKSLAKSAVKVCRECKHVFSPASSRLRAQQPHREPREGFDDAPILPRRRHRPSQRLIESLVVPAPEGGGEASATVPASAAAATRPPVAAAPNSSGGDAKQRSGVSGGGGGRPVGADGATGGGGPGQQQQPPKRSHKRKVPLPPGVAPPKRKKGAAAAARAAAAAAVAAADAAAKTTGAGAVPPGAGVPTSRGGILPLLTVPEQQRVAQDLLASPTPSRHTVPESPELAPMAPPAGPLLFMGPSSSNPSSGPLEDDSEWLSRGAGAGAGGGGCAEQQLLQRRNHHLQLQLQRQQQQRLLVRGVSPSLTGLLLEDEDEDDAQRVHGGDMALDLSADDAEERQERVDPFADVEMWWEGGGAVVNPSAGGQPAFSMVGKDGTIQQRVVFSQDTTELLGDTEDALMWNPLRSTSTGGGGGGSAAATGRTLSLLPGTSSNDNRLLQLSTQQQQQQQQQSYPSSFFLRGNSIPTPSSSPESLAFPNFERGAAIASSQAQVRAESLLAEASCSSLPGPLVFGAGGGAGAGAVAAVSADSGVGGAGVDEERGGFWHPFHPLLQPAGTGPAESVTPGISGGSSSSSSMSSHRSAAN